MTGLMYADVVPYLVREVPELLPGLEEHIRDNDVVLPHAFFGDVTRFAQAELRSGNTDTVQRLLAVLEDAVASTEEGVWDLIGASFLENLEDDPTVFSDLRALAGPKMKKALDDELDWRAGVTDPHINQEERPTRGHLFSTLATVVFPIAFLWGGLKLVTTFFPDWSPYLQAGSVVIPEMAVLYGIGLWRRRRNA